MSLILCLQFQEFAQEHIMDNERHKNISGFHLTLPGQIHKNQIAYMQVCSEREGRSSH
jgi:hypothetical protein